MKLSAIASTLLTAGALVAGSDLAFSQTTLNAHPGPASNGGSASWAIFFDVTATAPGVTITEMTTANSAPASGAFSIEVLVFNGSGLGGPVSAGPGSSPTGWTSLGSAPATQGATASGVSLPIDIPDIVLTQNQVTGVAVRFTGAGPRYADATQYGMYSDANLSLTTGDSRSQPFTPNGSYFSPRELVGSLTYTAGSGSVVYCSGDGTGTACPCGNSGTAGNGCANSLNPNGANLVTSGAASLSADSLVLLGTGMPSSSALYFQGTTQLNGGLGAVFGDGLRCVAGSIARLKTVINAGGASQYPQPGDPAVSVKGMVAAPGTRTYQVWYRNADPAFCTPSTFNLTNGVLVNWIN